MKSFVTGATGFIGGHVARQAERARRRRDLVDRSSALAGRKPPRLTLPVTAMKLSVPFGSIVGPLMGFGPNIRELISTSDGVTYWASDQKARRDLGYAPRDLETGLRQTLEKTF